jgi:hypothetical protein
MREPQASDASGACFACFAFREAVKRDELLKPPAPSKSARRAWGHRLGPRRG